MTQFLTALQESAFSTWLRESESVLALPTILTLHTIGLAVLVGPAWVFDLRVLGMARGIPLAPSRTLFRVMWMGLWINVITGVMLFCADAVRKGASVPFLLKMGFVLTGAVTVVLLRRHVYGPDSAPEAVSGTAKVLAVVSIVSWTAAISAGRLLAYVVR